MKAVIALILLFLISGCGFTGNVVNELSEQPTQLETDQSALADAVSSEDVYICYNILSQQVRESCFIQLAQIMDDPSICDNLLGNDLRASCIVGIQ